MWAYRYRGLQVYLAVFITESEQTNDKIVYEVKAASYSRLQSLPIGVNWSVDGLRKIVTLCSFFLGC